MSRRRFIVFEPAAGVGGVSYTDFHYTVSANNVNFFTSAGSPSSGNWNIIVDAGVVLGSTSTGTAAAVTGVFPGLLKITVLGRIQGKGGAGGRGAANSGKIAFARGGGGGGAGTQVGAGGLKGGNASDGSPGTATAGGAHGANGTTGTTQAATNGSDGGPALSLSMSATIDAGEIWGGGGGGGGAAVAETSGDGGGPGLIGGDAGSTNPGAAGNAVALNGNSVTWIAQTDVRGGVS